MTLSEAKREEIREYIEAHESPFGTSIRTIASELGVERGVAEQIAGLVLVGYSVGTAARMVGVEGVSAQTPEQGTLGSKESPIRHTYAEQLHFGKTSQGLKTLNTPKADLPSGSFIPGNLNSVLITLPPLPRAVGRPSVAHDTSSNTLYVIGGSVGGDVYFDHMQRYDPSTESWTLLTPLPTAKESVSAAYYNGKIYVFFGYNGSTLNEAHAYDIGNDTWTAISTPKNGTYGASAHEHNGLIYIFGGYTTKGGDSRTTVLQYDPAADSYTTMTAMSVGREFHASAYDSVNGTVHVIGGWDAKDAVGKSSHEMYDISADSWSTLAAYPWKVHLATSFHDSGYIYVMGGSLADSLDNITQIAQRYNISSDSWEDVQAHPMGMGDLSPKAPVINGFAYICGGAGRYSYPTAQMVGYKI